ncbi:MAG: amidase family protein, partial [Variovorax sp.]
MTMKNGNTITALRKRIARGELSHEALIDEVLEAAEQPAAQHVFTRLYADAARAAARHADAARKAGVETAPLAGLPVSVKDLYDVAGETTMAGSAVCAGEAPAAHDATAVARLRAQGAAIVGKTNMTEFAFSGVGINPHYGTPRNPADAQTPRIPGGSSSGAAVSVALGLAVAGLGSDTGGSIRIPAALCGLVGFKST